MPVHITNYNHKDHKGGVQNWGIAVSPEQILYVCNNSGLLRFNGNDWDLLEPNERAIVRAVRCIDDRIYAAGDNNIGYWEYGINGKITYVSLLPLVEKLNIRGETFWSIGVAGDRIYFHSFGNILCYDGTEMSFLVKDQCHTSLYQTGEGLFTQECKGTLLQIHEDRLSEFYNAPSLLNEGIRFLFQINADKYLIGLIDGSIYTLENNEAVLLTQLKNENQIPVRIDCGSIWKDEMLAVGTIGDGLFLLDLKNGEQTHIHSSQLQDLNVHGVCFANEHFIWLSLDNGISSVALNPETYLWKTNTETGIFFDAESFDEDIYIASNQGIYFYEDDGKKIQSSIYPLQFCNLKNELLCGATDLLYKKSQGRSAFEPFCNVNGVRQFEYVANHGDEYLFLRSYSGIALLQYIGNTWTYLSSLKNSEDYTYIMPENLNIVWAIQPGKGIYRLRIDKELSQIEDFEVFADIEGYSNYSRIRLVKIEDKIVFATPDGFYTYDVAEKSFRKLENLSNEIMYMDKFQTVENAYKNYIWVATHNELFLYRMTDLSAELVVSYPFAENELLLYDKHFNLKSINDSLTFVSTYDGTVVLNNKIAAYGIPEPHPLRIEAFKYSDKEDLNVYVDFHQPEIELPNTATNVTINISTGLQTRPALISYRLSGVRNEWSAWQNSGTIYFTNLPSGRYELEIKDSYQNSLIIPIQVSPPFYLRIWMIMIYILLLIIVTVAIVNLISERKRKKLLEQYEEEQRKHAEVLKQQAYEQLQEKVKSQENELKNRMRYLTQKQEILESISTEVEAQKKELGERYPNKLYRRLMKLIQEGATEKDKLLSFENYFVEVYYDFMQQLQKSYPDLSPSELKFCCLLRANLTTKEISAIMGIAVRSVELKKYRLKRKLNLDAENSLTSFILGL